MVKQRDKGKAQNLKNIDPELFRLIDVYNINQQFLTEKVYTQEWSLAEDAITKNKLIGRLRNKLLGFGKLLPGEYEKLQSIMADIAKDMSETVSISILKTNSIKKEKIRKILQNYDDATIEELLNHL